MKVAQQDKLRAIQRAAAQRPKNSIGKRNFPNCDKTDRIHRKMRPEAAFFDEINQFFQ